MAELTNKVDFKTKNSTSSGMQKRKRWHSAPPAGVRGRLQHPVQTQEHSHVLCQAQQQSHGVWPDQGPHQHVSANNCFQCVFTCLGFTTSTSRVSKIHPALLECTSGFRVVINFVAWPSGCPAWPRTLSEHTLSLDWCCWSPSSLLLATGFVRDQTSPLSLDSRHSHNQRVKDRHSI